jgi:hypothetical protein
MMTGEIEYHAGGELVEIKAPRMTVVLTRDEWIRGIRRGKSVLRNRAMRAREVRDLDRKIAAVFPHFE